MMLVSSRKSFLLESGIIYEKIVSKRTLHNKNEVHKMIHRLRGLLKSSCYRLLYGCRVHFGGIPSMRPGASIKCQKGEMHAGHHFSMNSGSYCAAIDGGKLVIGDSVSINRNTMIICHDRITIGSKCSIGPNVSIYDHDHKFDENGITSGFKTSPVTIADHCWIGGGCTILRGSHIGEGSVIGAGCIITGDIPPHSLVTSNRTLNITPIISSEMKKKS